jgi:hypothetical protein
MDKTTLVENDIEDGKKLIEALDNASFNVHSALWYYLSDSDQWRFIIASPLVDKKSPKEAYSLIQGILAKISPQIKISLKDVSVVSPKLDLIQLLRIAIHTGPGVSGIRFKGNTINNVFIEDAYIYRVQ